MKRKNFFSWLPHVSEIDQLLTTQFAKQPLASSQQKEREKYAKIYKLRDEVPLQAKAGRH